MPVHMSILYDINSYDIKGSYHDIIKILAITLMYCNRLHAWWSTQSGLATLLFSLIRGSCIDKLGFIQENQTSMCLDPHLN